MRWYNIPLAAAWMVWHCLLLGSSVLYYNHFRKDNIPSIIVDFDRPSGFAHGESSKDMFYTVQIIPSHAPLRDVEVSVSFDAEWLDGPTSPITFLQGKKQPYKQQFSGIVQTKCIHGFLYSLEQVFFDFTSSNGVVNP